MYQSETIKTRKKAPDLLQLFFLLIEDVAFNDV